MSQQKPSVIVKISSSLSTAIFDCKIDSLLFVKVNCQAQLSEISQRHQHTNPAFSINMLGHTVVGCHLSERYTQTECALIMH